MSEPQGLTPKHVEEIRAYWSVYAPIQHELNDRLTARLQDDPIWKPILDSMSEEVRVAQNKRSFALQEAAVLHGKWDEYLSDLRMQGVGYAQMGIPFHAWFDLLAMFRDDLVPSMVAASNNSTQYLVMLLSGLARYLDITMAVIGEAYVDAKQRIISETQDKLITIQRASILELSTPVIEVSDRVLVLPIIGTLDSERTSRLTESLLDRIAAQQAEVVILDISGVPTIDTQVSQYLLKTVQAARLMGATTILSGVRPETAQAIVHLGIDLGDLRSRRTLRDALIVAMKIVASSGGAA